MPRIKVKNHFPGQPNFSPSRSLRGAAGRCFLGHGFASRRPVFTAEPTAARVQARAHCTFHGPVFLGQFGKRDLSEGLDTQPGAGGVYAELAERLPQ